MAEVRILSDDRIEELWTRHHGGLSLAAGAPPRQTRRTPGCAAAPSDRR